VKYPKLNVAAAAGSQLCPGGNDADGRRNGCSGVAVAVSRLVSLRSSRCLGSAQPTDTRPILLRDCRSIAPHIGRSDTTVSLRQILAKVFLKRITRPQIAGTGLSHSDQSLLLDPMVDAYAHVDEPEPRWQALLAIAAVGGVYLALPAELVIGPTWLLPMVIAFLLAPTIVTHRIGRHSINHVLGIVNNGIITVALVGSVTLLVATLP
jgi:hypothetical protein